MSTRNRLHVRIISFVAEGFNQGEPNINTIEEGFFGSLLVLTLISYDLFMIDEKVVRQQGELDGVTNFTTGIAVFQKGKLLVVRRTAEDDVLAGEWELPGGGVDPGETIEQGAIRELLEETNLEVDKILNTFNGFDYTTLKKPKARQINFKVTVKSGDIKLTEHDMYRWIYVTEIPSLKTNKVMQNCLSKAFA